MTKEDVEMWKELKVSFHDSDNILYKPAFPRWIGKRAVLKVDKRVSWLEDTTEENIKKYLHGKDADYEEIFYMGEEKK